MGVQIFTTPGLGFGNIFIHKAKCLRNNLLASVASVKKWSYSCFHTCATALIGIS